MGKQVGDYGDSNKMGASAMKPVVMFWLYFESRLNRLTDRLNVDCWGTYWVKDIIIHCYGKFTGLKNVLFVIPRNLSWVQLSDSAVWYPRRLLHWHIWLSQLEPPRTNRWGGWVSCSTLHGLSMWWAQTLLHYWGLKVIRVSLRDWVQEGRRCCLSL